jgi:hypothetical protein
MTVGKRITIEPADISAIEFECCHCQLLTAVPIAKLDRLNGTCPNCHEQWFQKGGPEEVALGESINAIKALQHLALKAKVRFHLKVTDAAL